MELAIGLFDLFIWFLLWESYGDEKWKKREREKDARIMLFDAFRFSIQWPMFRVQAVICELVNCLVWCVLCIFVGFQSMIINFVWQNALKRHLSIAYYDDEWIRNTHEQHTPTLHYYTKRMKTLLYLWPMCNVQRVYNVPHYYLFYFFFSSFVPWNRF